MDVLNFFCLGGILMAMLTMNRRLIDLEQRSYRIDHRVIQLEKDNTVSQETEQPSTAFEFLTKQQDEDREKTE